MILGCTSQSSNQIPDAQITPYVNEIETVELVPILETPIEKTAPAQPQESTSTRNLQVQDHSQQVNAPTSAPQQQASPTPTPYNPEDWIRLPVIPKLSPKVKEIYERGLLLGNNPQNFSKIGDCGSTPAWFLGDFDHGSRFYELGEYQALIEVIDHFQGSFARTSLAAKSGFNASSIFTSLWADRKYCQSNEIPLNCEYRVNKPAFAFITLGTNDVWHQDSFEPQMRKIIELSIEEGVIPILSTKADNREGDGSINSTIARLAVEYKVPLWNFWLAVQPLPDHGLQEDGSHLTWGPNQFDDPQVLQRAWPIRNLTALQVLDEIWRYVASP